MACAARVISPPPLQVRMTFFRAMFAPASLVASTVLSLLNRFSARSICLWMVRLRTVARAGVVPYHFKFPDRLGHGSFTPLACVRPGVPYFSGPSSQLVSLRYQPPVHVVMTHPYGRRLL